MLCENGGGTANQRRAHQTMETENRKCLQAVAEKKPHTVCFENVAVLYSRFPCAFWPKRFSGRRAPWMREQKALSPRNTTSDLGTMVLRAQQSNELSAYTLNLMATWNNMAANRLFSAMAVQFCSALPMAGCWANERKRKIKRRRKTRCCFDFGWNG